MPYVIDGNNLLGSWGGTRKEDGRAEVLRRVGAFCRARGARAVVVFDGPPLRQGLEEQSFGCVRVRVPPRGGDADGVIRKMLTESSRPADLIVVSSDKAVYSYARHRGASVLRAHEWNSIERQLPAPRAGEEKPQREDDVEGWLAIFGGDEPG